MNKMILALSAAALVSLVIGPAYAVLGPSSGPYFSANAGYGGAKNHHGIAATINGGYKYNIHLAFEGGAGFFPGSKYYVDGAVKLIMPLSIGYSVFAKGGVAINFKHLAPIVGLGGNYFFTQTFVGTIQGLAIIGHSHSLPNMYAATLGVTWFLS